jgi:KRAB domain-containing zinc finger protein
MKRIRDGKKIEEKNALLQQTNDSVIVSLPDEFKNIHVCDICGYTTTKSALVQHKVRRHGEKDFQCDLCNKWFSRKCELSTHRTSHFNNQGNLRKIRKVENIVEDDNKALINNVESGSDHLAGNLSQSDDVGDSHKEDKLYTCDVCGFQTTFHGLRVHKRRKHREKKFECDICSKKFHTNNLLQKHRASHFSESGELKPWEKDKCALGESVKCDDCDIVFSNKRAMEIHISKKHNRVKKFMCEYCLYKGFTKNDVQVHVARKHMSHDHKCDVCGKMYAFAKELERHQIVIHKGLEQCKCHICGQEFKMVR